MFAFARKPLIAAVAVAATFSIAQESLAQYPPQYQGGYNQPSKRVVLALRSQPISEFKKLTVVRRTSYGLQRLPQDASERIVRGLFDNSGWLFYSDGSCTLLFRNNKGGVSKTHGKWSRDNDGKLWVKIVESGDNPTEIVALFDLNKGATAVKVKTVGQNFGADYLFLQKVTPVRPQA